MSIMVPAVLATPLSEKLACTLSVFHRDDPVPHPHAQIHTQLELNVHGGHMTQVHRLDSSP